jgi:phosphatidylserine/phosphatidylglycerophosphate/cardiolipin synthase-like enzyme
MPWHDMTVGMVGPIARDVARHFIQRWNFLKASKGMHRPTVPFLMPKGEYVAARDESSFKGTCRVQMLRSSAQWSSGIEREHSIYNAYMECISKSKHFVYIENQFFSKLTIIWNNLVCLFIFFFLIVSATTQDKLLRNKIAQALVERIKRAHAKGENYKVFIIIPLIPAFEGDLATKDAAAARNVMHFQYITISRGGNSIMEKLREAGIEPSDYIGWYSLRNWDKLVPPKKTSPQTTPSPSPSPKPDVSPTLSSVDPPVPTTSTSPIDTSTTSEKSIWDDDDRHHYVSELVYIHDKILIVDDRIVLIGSANINDRSQLGNRDSEIAMLIEDTDMVPSFMDGKEYKAAKFAHSLRMQLFKEHLGLLDFTNWEQLIKGEAKRAPNVDVDEPTETHHTNEHTTKEEIRVFESAGPDRVLEHEKRSGANPIDSTDFGTMAVRLDAKALDPLAPHCHQDIWNATAKNNTMIYRDLFRCVPDDTVHTFEQHRKFLPDPTKIPHGHVADPDLHGREIRHRLGKVRGHLVQFPLDYLKDENMLGSLIRETVTPMVIFT